MNVSDQRGKVLNDIYNEDGSEDYKYYYYDPQHSTFH